MKIEGEERAEVYEYVVIIIIIIAVVSACATLTMMSDETWSHGTDVNDRRYTFGIRLKYNADRTECLSLPGTHARTRPLARARARLTLASA